ncbi:MAG: hypothetical protein GXP26_17660 [Planctomycetes bacterium]|nr:hypothetical protein [Planctomycetota bacterium]
MLSSLTSRLRSTGFLATGLWVAYRLAQRCMTLDVTRLVWLDGSTANFKESTDSRLTFRFLTPEDILKFSEDATNELNDSFVERIEESQHLCFAALSEGRLAAYAWYTPHRAEAECNQGRHKNTGVDFSYPDHVVFMYKGFTHPEFRGQGLYGLVNGLAMRSLADRGISHILSTMDWTNIAARRSCSRLGFVELGIIYRWGWGRWMNTNAPLTFRPLGIKIGNEAACNHRCKPSKEESPEAIPSHLQPT